MNNYFIILAAGKSDRFKSNIPKPFIQYKGDILINHSINKAILSRKFKKIVIAVNRSHKKYIKRLKKPNLKIISGGKTRADSARICIEYLKKFKPRNVLIHDAARPNYSVILIHKLLSALKSNDAVIPVLNSRDTVKFKKLNNIRNVNRNNIYFTQTPQAFKYDVIKKLQNNIDYKITDDSTLLIDAKKKIKFIKGEINNIKITNYRDIIQNKIYYGIGFDVHRLIKNKKMYLGGVNLKLAH